MKQTFSLLLLLTTLGLRTLSFGQGIIDAGQDTAICLPGSVTLTANIGLSQSPTILSDQSNPLSDDAFTTSGKFRILLYLFWKCLYRMCHFNK